MAYYDDMHYEMTRKCAAPPLKLQKLRNMLDMKRPLDQLDKLIAAPIRIPGTSTLPYPGSPNKTRHSVFSIKTIWPSDSERKNETSKLFNFGNMDSRKLLKDTLLHESDSESGGETTIDSHQIHTLTKMHRRRRKIQKWYPSDLINSKYVYIGAGVYSMFDRFPGHQASVLRQKRFTNSASLSNTVRQIHENVKSLANKFDSAQPGPK